MQKRKTTSIKSQSTNSLSIILLAIGACTISFCPVFVKIANVGPAMAGFYRMIFGGFLLSIIVILRKDKFFFNKNHTLLNLLCSILFALDLSLWHRSVHYIGPGLSTLLGNFQVFFMAAFGIFILKEKPSKLYICSIPLAMIGLYLIIGSQWSLIGGDYKRGVILGLLTALCYASYLLTLRKTIPLAHESNHFSTMALQSWFAAIVLGIEAIFQGESFIIPDTVSIWALVGYGIAGQVVGWVLISMGVKKVKASLVGLILLLQPTLSFIWDILFFNRLTTWSEITGALIALTAIYLGSISPK